MHCNFFALSAKGVRGRGEVFVCTNAGDRRWIVDKWFVWQHLT